MRWRSVIDAEDHVVFVSGDRVDVDVAHEVRAAVLNLRPDLPMMQLSYANSQRSPS